MIELFKAKTDTVFGIKENDVIEYDTVNKKAVLQRTNKIVPLNPKVEKKFFEAVPAKPVSLFQVADLVHLKIVMNLEIVGGKGFKKPHRFFKQHAYLSMKIIDIKPDLQAPRLRRKVSPYFYIVEVGDYQYKVPQTLEQHLEKTEHYWFISSKGKVQQDIVGKDLKVDKFRQRVNNYFTVEKVAAQKLQDIL